MAHALPLNAQHLTWAYTRMTGILGLAIDSTHEIPTLRFLVTSFSRKTFACAVSQAISLNFLDLEKPLKVSRPRVLNFDRYYVNMYYHTVQFRLVQAHVRPWSDRFE